MRRQEANTATEFRYEARDDNGALVSGWIAAESREKAGELLSGRGIFVVRLAEIRHKRRNSGRPHATRGEIAWQMWQLSAMVDSGMGLSESLECLARQATKPSLRLLLEQVSKDVREGQPLSEAMSRHPDVFPASLIAMIGSSELSGSLSIVLKQSSAYLVKDLQTLQRMYTALAYPIVMLMLCMGVMVFLLAFVLPRFASVFASKGEILPAPTRLLMGVSQSLIDSWPIWLGAVLAIGIVAALWLRSEFGRRCLDHLAITLPGVAPLFNTLHQCRAFRTLSMLLDAQVPLIDSIRVVHDIVPNSFYRELWDELQEQIQVGERFAPPLFASKFIDESVAQMVDNGDRAGRLSNSFRHLADFMDERYNRSIAAAMRFIEPAMVLLMGVLVGFVAIAMLLPLFRAAQVVSG